MNDTFNHHMTTPKDILEEDIPVADRKAYLKTTFPFGKHQGRKIKDVAKENPWYVHTLWTKQQDLLVRKDILQALVFCFFYVDHTMPFGKHKGKTLRYLTEYQEDYIEWLLLQREKEKQVDWLYTKLNMLEGDELMTYWKNSPHKVMSRQIATKSNKVKVSLC